MFRIGVDVGGTNTDAVLMQGKEVVDGYKSATTEEPGLGIINAVSTILNRNNIDTKNIESVMIGTTQFTNAFVENKRLEQVAVVRLGYPATVSVPPCIDFSDNLRKIIGENFWIVNGGYEFDGRLLGDWTAEEITKVAKEIKNKNLNYISISCVFSPINEQQEIDTAKIIKEHNTKYKINKVSEVESFSIKFLVLRNYIYKNILSFGDLIHKVHPLAGQGFNMTIRDIKSLIKILDNNIKLGIHDGQIIAKEFQENNKHLNFIYGLGIDTINSFFKIDSKFKHNLSNPIFKILKGNKLLNNVATFLSN